MSDIARIEQLQNALLHLGRKQLGSGHKRHHVIEMLVIPRIDLLLDVVEVHEHAIAIGGDIATQPHLEAVRVTMQPPTLSRVIGNHVRCVNRSFEIQNRGGHACMVPRGQACARRMLCSTMTDHAWTPPAELASAATTMLRAIGTSPDTQQALTWTDEQWNDLAIMVFRAQVEHIPAYRAWCDHELRSRHQQVTDITDWTAIPALPISAFKRTRVAAHPAAADERVWESSGTTASTRSQHALPNTELYDASLRAGSRMALCGGAATSLRRVIQLAPAGTVLPSSSLSHMFDAIRTELADDGGAWADANSQVDCAGAWSALTHAAADGVPVLLLATSFALVQLLEATADAAPLTLPATSVVVDTGGYKGRTRELSRAELLDLIHTRLGVPAAWCENEYGMSELSSQAWLGTAARMDGAPLNDIHTPDARWQPPWMRTRVVNPRTLTEVADGESGLLVHHDLANVWSCACIRTEDIGIRVGATYVMTGRAPGAELKGCSLRVEDVL